VAAEAISGTFVAANRNPPVSSERRDLSDFTSIWFRFERESEDLMRRTGMCALVGLAISLLASSDAMAQGRGGRGGFGQVGPAQLLAAPKVQEDLKLTDDQKSKIAALVMEGRGGGRRGGGRNASPEERAAAEKAAQERNEKFEAVLTADQKKRLKEITIQARGPASLSDEAVAKELALTDSQKASVKTIAELVAKKIMDLPQLQQGDDFAARFREIQEIQTAANEEYLAVLSAEQKTKFTAMQGAKIDDLAAALRGGGGRGGRGRRNNN